MLKQFLFCSLLSISFLIMPFNINKFLSIEKNNSSNDTLSNLKIIYVYGDLYEHDRNATLHLLVNNPINPLILSNISIITRDFFKMYALNTHCFYENNSFYEEVTNIKCILDLNEIQKGDYFINSFYYNSTLVINNYTLITVKEHEEEKKDNKTEKIELMNVYTNGYENMSYQNISLFFKEDNVNIDLIKSMSIIGINESKKKVNLMCLFKEMNSSVLCLANFSNVYSGFYYVKLLEYNYSNINVSNDIRFYIMKKKIEEELKLLYAYGEAYTNNSSLFNLKFNKNVTPYDFQDFFLIDTKSNISYYLNYSLSKRDVNASIDILFHFYNESKGYYTLNFVYKNKTYLTNITLRVNEKEIFLENELLEVYHNFKSNRDNQTAYFSFAGTHVSNYLAYIVINDGFSKINVLQTLDCNTISSSINGFDLRCQLNLTHVDKGNYTVSEYYLNNQHYNTKKIINIIRICCASFIEFHILLTDIL